MSDDKYTTLDETVKSVTNLNKWLLALFVALLIFLLVETFVIVNTINSANRAKEVFSYPIQEVESRVPGVDGPAIRIPSDGGQFDNVVKAEKCSDFDEEVLVSTRVSWDTVDPRGTLIEDWNGIQAIQPGCADYDYTNQVPSLVVDRTLQLIKDFPTLDCVRWTIVGVDTPLNPRQAPERWLTESFCIYPPINSS